MVTNSFCLCCSSFPAILQQYHDVTDADEREATGIYESKVTVFSY